MEISEEQASVLIECHRLNAYVIFADEDVILERTGASHKTIDQLCTLKCIELIEGKIKLVEEIKIL